jgi:hypothetical protein
MPEIIINKAFENGVNEMMKEYGKQVTEVLSKVYGFNVEEAFKHIEPLQAFTIKKEEKGKATRKKVEVKKEPLPNALETTEVVPIAIVVDADSKPMPKKTKKAVSVVPDADSVPLPVPKKTVKRVKKDVSVVTDVDSVPVPLPKKTVQKTKKMIIDSTPKKEETVILFPLLDDEDEDDIYIQKINGKNHCINEKSGSIYEYKTENDGQRGAFIGVYKNGEAVFNN